MVEFQMAANWELVWIFPAGWGWNGRTGVNQILFYLFLDDVGVYGF